MKKVLKRQRTILGRVMRDLERRLPEMAEGMKPIAALWLERARCIHTQRPKGQAQAACPARAGGGVHRQGERPAAL